MMPMIICAIETPEDRDFMTDFYLQHRGFLYSQAQKYLQNPQDAEDIVHDTLVKLIDHMDVFRGLQPTQQLVYARVTVKHLACSLCRRENRIPMVAFDDILPISAAEESQQPENILQSNQRQEKIGTIWNSLDGEDRLLLEQKYILRWSDEELAKHLDIQPQSVRMRLTRARRSVAHQMEKQGFLPSQW